MRRKRTAARRALLALAVLACGAALANGTPSPPHSEIREQALFFSNYMLFIDPDPYVVGPGERGRQRGDAALPEAVFP